MANRRIRKNTQRRMHRRMIAGKKPMSLEEKEARKRKAELQRDENKKRLERKAISK